MRQTLSFLRGKTKTGTAPWSLLQLGGMIESLLYLTHAGSAVLSIS